MRDLAAIMTLGALMAGASSATGQQISLVQISTNFNSPIGIDHHEPSNSVVLSVNYSNNGQPWNFERILADGSHVQFSTVSGFTDEVKIATIRSGATGGFTPGDLFVGNGTPGEIARITDDGNTVISPWAQLGSAAGLMRGSLYHDRTDVFGGDLIAVTTTGEVWRIHADGSTSGTPLATLATHLEGLITVPDDAATYGPLAGTIICGAENQHLLYSIDPAGQVSSYSLGVDIEDIEMISPSENFFGINFGTNLVLGAPASQFTSMVGDILLTQEVHSGSGLFRLHWDGTSLSATQLTLAAGSASPGQWEHVTFSPAGITPLNGYPFFSSATPCGMVVPAQVGVPLSITIEALDNDTGDSVTLDAVTLPAGASMTPALPAVGNPISSLLGWTPTNADVGLHAVEFNALDSGGLDVACSFVISVEDPVLSTCMGVNCPCQNDDASAGCANSTGVGGLLTAGGTTSVATDDLTLNASQMPAGFYGGLYMGQDPDCTPLGDGLRGVLQGPPNASLLFPVRLVDANGRFSEGPGLASYSTSLFGAAGTILGGTTWYFQVFYRDPFGTPCGSHFNLTNALSVTFH